MLLILEKIRDWTENLEEEHEADNSPLIITEGNTRVAFQFVQL